MEAEVIQVFRDRDIGPCETCIEKKIKLFTIGGKGKEFKICKHCAQRLVNELNTALENIK